MSYRRRPEKGGGDGQLVQRVVCFDGELRRRAPLPVLRCHPKHAKATILSSATWLAADSVTRRAWGVSFLT